MKIKFKEINGIRIQFQCCGSKIQAPTESLNLIHSVNAKSIRCIACFPKQLSIGTELRI